MHTILTVRRIHDGGEVPPSNAISEAPDEGRDVELYQTFTLKLVTSEFKKSYAVTSVLYLHVIHLCRKLISKKNNVSKPNL